MDLTSISSPHCDPVGFQSANKHRQEEQVLHTSHVPQVFREEEKHSVSTQQTTSIRTVGL